MGVCSKIVENNWMTVGLTFLAILMITSAATNLPGTELTENDDSTSYEDYNSDPPVFSRGVPCDYLDELKFHGETWRPVSCSECICENGTLDCYNLECFRSDCDDPLQIDGECCPQCFFVDQPGKMLSREGRTLEQFRFNVDIEIFSQAPHTSIWIRGTNLWRIGAWVSRNSDGTGRKFSYNANILNDDMRAKELKWTTQTDDPENGQYFRFKNVKYSFDATEGSCQDYKYLCVEFNITDDPKPANGLSITYTVYREEYERQISCVRTVMLSACRGCEASASYTTDHEYNYRYLPLRLSTNPIEFRVKAEKDALISLSSSTTGEGDVYEIVIGGGDNTWSAIRRCAPCNEEVMADTAGILSVSEFRRFLITLNSSGLLSVFKYGEEIAFMNWTDPNPFQINYLGYSTQFGSDGEFQFCNLADSVCPGNVDEYLVDGRKCTSVCWSEPTGSSSLFTYRSHTPSTYFNVGSTEVTYQYNYTTTDRISQCRFNVTVREACMSGTIDAITRTSDGHTYMFVGDLVIKLAENGTHIADGYPKPICAVFPGIPSDLDAAVYWPNGETYFFKGQYYWTSNGTSISSMSPQLIPDGFPGISANVDAVMRLGGEKGTAYFFHGSERRGYDISQGRIISMKSAHISDVWYGSGVDAALQWSNGVTYLFTGEVYWGYHNGQTTDDYSGLTTRDWLGCTEENPEAVMSADAVCVPDLCSEHSVPYCFDGNFDAITHIHTGSSRGNIFVFRGMMVVRLTEASGDIGYGFPKPICAVFPGLPSGLDAALTFKDTGETYFFKGDLCYRFRGFQMDSGYPQLISTTFPGVPSGIDAAVVTGFPDEQQTFFFKDDMFYTFNGSLGRVPDGYPKTIRSEWTGIPDDVSGAFQWINTWTYFFKGDLYYRWDYKRNTVPDRYPMITTKTWFGCEPSGNTNTCWLRQCQGNH